MVQNFTSDIHGCSQEGVLDTPEQVRMLNEVACEHFLRQGRLDVARHLVQVVTLLRNSVLIVMSLMWTGRWLGY